MTRHDLAAGLLLLGAALCGADAPTGWRQDGTGRFPKAAPPTEWGKDHNVLWKLKMPGRSFGSPVLVGERLYIVSDPGELLCLRATDGKLLWQTKTTLAEVFGAERAAEIAKEYKALDDERNRLAREADKVRKEQPDDKDKIKEARARVTEAEKKVREREAKVPRPEGRRAAGNTAATPVTDGKRIVVVFGTGVVACFDVEGKRLWTRFVETSPIGFGHSASPVLVGGKVIVHLRDLVALDLATGKEAWRVAHGGSHASPLAARLGTEAVVITPTGLIARASDGKVLLKGGKFQTSESTLVLDGDVLYAPRSGRIEAMKLTLTDDKVKVESLWQSEAASERRTPSSLLHDGLLYNLTTSGVLEVTDVKTGERLYRERLGLSEVYSSLVLAGTHLYAFDTRGKTVVFKPGRAFERVAQNTLEGTGSCPVAAGGRLYVRGQQHLYCLSATPNKNDPRP